MAALLVVVLCAVFFGIVGECFKVHEHAPASVALPVATNTEHERASLGRLVALALILAGFSNVGGVVGLLVCLSVGGLLHGGAKFGHFYNSTPEFLNICRAALWGHAAAVPAIRAPRLALALVHAAAVLVGHDVGQLCHKVGEGLALGALQGCAHQVGEVLGGGVIGGGCARLVGGRAVAVQVAGCLLVLVHHLGEVLGVASRVGVQLLAKFAVLSFQALGGVGEINKVFHNL